MSHLKLPQLPPYQKQHRKSYAGYRSTQSTPSPTSNFSTAFQLIVTAPATSLASNSSKSKMSCDQKIPDGFVTMEHQVAGHTFTVGTDQIGMLKSIDDGSVLKPAGSPMCAARETKFYEQLLTTSDKDILPLRDFIAEYRGTQTLTVGSRTVNFIKLRDLTHEMLEPCVIDIKIGRRTWDPLATEQKREAEEGKYQDCKHTVGFCIPGLQTYHIASGNYKKYGKEYGKKLNENTVKDALRLFLNADSGLCRQLIMQILTNLWAIQKWIRTQKVYQFYSSSILIVYDARKLRQILEAKGRIAVTPDICNGSDSPFNNSKTNCSNPGSLRGSGDSLNAADSTVKGSPTPLKPIYRKIQRSHSSMNNYEQEMRKMKDNYALMLDNLVGIYDNNKEWVHVKMIDFAHTFNINELADGQAAAGIDRNYLDGIEHLVEIFEDFLKLCD